MKHFFCFWDEVEFGRRLMMTLATGLFGPSSIEMGSGLLSLR